MKNKILTFGFDDCEIYDRQLAELFRKYGMKATFFLLTGSFCEKIPFHRYGEDTVVERISKEEIPETYRGMEVASHTESHRCNPDDFYGTIGKSCETLSKNCGYEVNGFAYPGGHYTDELVESLKENGIIYARTATETYNFNLPKDLLKWDPTCKYDAENIEKLVDEFLEYNGDEPKLFYIYGHSYELTQKQEGKSFDWFEKILKKLSFRDDISYATNKEIAEWMRER